MPPRKRKCPKDKNAPKKALTAFMLYAGDMRPKLREEHPKWKMTEYTKEIGALWKKLSDEDKKPYQATAATAKVKCDAAAKHYKTTADFTAYQQIKKDWLAKEAAKPFPKDKNAPKRAPSSYMVFSSEKRHEVTSANPGMKVTEIGKLLGARWKELTDAEKQAYADKSKILKADYELRLAEYRKTDEHKEWLAGKQAFDAKKKLAAQKAKQKAAKKKAKVPEPVYDEDNGDYEEYYSDEGGEAGAEDDDSEPYSSEEDE